MSRREEKRLARERRWATESLRRDNSMYAGYFLAREAMRHPNYILMGNRLVKWKREDPAGKSKG